MTKHSRLLVFDCLFLRPFVPALVPPKIPDGEIVDFDVSTVHLHCSLCIKAVNYSAMSVINHM